MDKKTVTFQKLDRYLTSLKGNRSTFVALTVNLNLTYTPGTLM